MKISIICCIFTYFCLSDNLISLTGTMLSIQITKMSTLAIIIDYVCEIYGITDQTSSI